jgi:hypothetical protein
MHASSRIRVPHGRLGRELHDRLERPSGRTPVEHEMTIACPPVRVDREAGATVGI